MGTASVYLVDALKGAWHVKAVARWSMCVHFHFLNYCEVAVTVRVYAQHPVVVDMRGVHQGDILFAGQSCLSGINYLLAPDRVLTECAPLSVYLR